MRCSWLERRNADLEKGYFVRNVFCWPESNTLLVDFMNSFYLNKEPDTFSVRSIKYGDLHDNAIFIQETCDRDLRLCLQASQMPFEYWTNIFSVLQFCVLASSVLLRNEDVSCKEAAWAIIATASEIINGVMVKNFDAGSFEKGFLNELKGDLELLAGEIRRASDSYCVALTNYRALAVEDEENYVLYPEVETMFLQCDYIWHEKLSPYVKDSYSFVRDFSKRVEIKLLVIIETSNDVNVAS
jgi:hypothetical protein